MMLKYVYILFFMHISFFSLEMDAKELITKMHEAYEKKSFLEYNCTYQLFKGHTSSVVETSYEAYMLRSGKNLYQKVNLTECIYGSDFFIKVSHAENLVEVSSAKLNVNTQENFTEVLKVCSAIELEEKKGSYELSFSFEDVSKYPFSSIKLLINKKTLYIEELDYYYLESQDFSKDNSVKDMQQAHLKVKFSKYNEEAKETKALFSWDTYFKTEKDHLIPLGVYSNYTVYDHRKKQ